MIKTEVLRIIKWSHCNYIQSYLENLLILLYIVIILRNFNQNWFINECAVKKKAKIIGSWSHRVLESQSLLTRYRRTYSLIIFILSILNMYLFAGFASNMVAIRNLYQDYVSNGPLEYLLVRKLSQDYLEHFFGRYFFLCSIMRNTWDLKYID